MLDRRTLLKSGLMTGALGIQGLLARPTLATPALRRDFGNDIAGYGKLVPTKAKNTGE
jgi:hypothetical protein